MSPASSCNILPFMPSLHPLRASRPLHRTKVQKALEIIVRQSPHLRAWSLSSPCYHFIIKPHPKGCSSLRVFIRVPSFTCLKKQRSAATYSGNDLYSSYCTPNILRQVGRGTQIHQFGHYKITFIIWPLTRMQTLTHLDSNTHHRPPEYYQKDSFSSPILS